MNVGDKIYIRFMQMELQTIILKKLNDAYWFAVTALPSDPHEVSVYESYLNKTLYKGIEVYTFVVGNPHARVITLSKMKRGDGHFAKRLKYISGKIQDLNLNLKATRIYYFD